MLVLLAVGLDGPDLLLIQRSGELRLHAGEPAFPGGTIDAADDGPVAAALREAAEEVGVDPGGVGILAILPELFIPPTRFRVVPVLTWRRACAVAPVDPGEVAAVARVSVTELAEPSARLTVRMPIGATLPAFRVRACSSGELRPRLSTACSHSPVGSGPGIPLRSSTCNPHPALPGPW